MKRKGLLALAGCDAVRFEVLQARGQLPIQNCGRWSDYTLSDAFALRLTLDLIGDQAPGEEHLGGVPPSYAHKVIANAIATARARYRTLGDLMAGRALIGGVIFETSGEDPFRFSAWFAGPPEELPPWTIATGAKEGAEPVRFLLVNAARAARQIEMAAKELGIDERPEEAPL